MNIWSRTPEVICAHAHFVLAGPTRSLDAHNAVHGDWLASSGQDSPDDVAFILCATGCLSSGGHIEGVVDLVHAALTRKEKEEEQHFERVFILRQLGMPRIDKDQEECRFATKGREMFNQPT